MPKTVDDCRWLPGNLVSSFVKASNLYGNITTYARWNGCWGCEDGIPLKFEIYEADAEGASRHKAAPPAIPASAP